MKSLIKIEMYFAILLPTNLIYQLGKLQKINKTCLLLFVFFNSHNFANNNNILGDKMNKILLAFLLSAFLCGHIFSKDKLEKDRETIKSMCGCYEVQFNFIETFNFSRDTAYQPSKEMHDPALEWVELVEESDNKIVMQHLLITGSSEQTRIIKHWRQDWFYENQGIFQYDHNFRWNYVELPEEQVEGQWTQKVYQVDDSPRYEGTATWVYVDGKAFWESETDAPLPRREHTKRDDYNVTLRRNRHEITDWGWIHDQYNDKIIRKEGEKDRLLAQEKGYNTYRKTDKKYCEEAITWWSKHKQKWELVREVWEEMFANKEDIKLHKKVDEKMLHEVLFPISTDASKEEIKQVIEKYIAKN